MASRSQKTLVLALVLLAIGSASAWKRTAVVIMGDSLSDAGNFARAVNYTAPTPKAYYKGRFTTSPGVWGDQLPKYVKTPLVAPNFAFAGATACGYDFIPAPFNRLPTADTLVRQYLSALKAPNSSLARSLRGYTTVPWLWLGANDVQYLSFLPADRVLSVALQLPTNISRCLTNAASLLLDNGHKHVVISTMAPFELTPLAFRTNTNQQAAQIVTFINQAIRAAVAKLQQQYPKANVVLSDLHTDISTAINNATSLGFKFGPPATCFKIPVTFSPSSGDVPASQCAHPDEYVFVDNLHPSAGGHRVIVRSALKTLVQAKLISWTDTRPVPIITKRR